MPFWPSLPAVVYRSSEHGRQRVLLGATDALVGRAAYQVLSLKQVAGSDGAVSDRITFSSPFAPQVFVRDAASCQNFRGGPSTDGEARFSQGTVLPNGSPESSDLLLNVNCGPLEFFRPELSDAQSSQKSGPLALQNSGPFVSRGRPGLGPVAVNDLNGDGRLDVLEWGDSRFKGFRYYANESTRQQQWFGSPAEVGLNSGLALPLAMTVHGDGRATVVVMPLNDHHRPTGECLALVATGPGQPAEWEPIHSWFNAPHMRFSRVTVLDANGDGLSDLYWNGQTILNFGGPVHIPGIVRSGALSWSTLENGDIKRHDLAVPFDYNGDGEDDLLVPVVRSSQEVAWLLVPGKSTFRPPQGKGTQLIDWQPVKDAGLVGFAVVADLNGDGAQDWVTWTADWQPVVRYNRGRRLNLLKQVQNGLGQQIDIDYDARGTCDPKPVEMQLAGYSEGSDITATAPLLPGLVSSHSVGQIVPEEGVRIERQYSYRYQDGRRDPVRNKWLGFTRRWITERDRDGTQISETQIDYDNRTFVNSAGDVPEDPLDPSAVYVHAGRPLRVVSQYTEGSSELNNDPDQVFGRWVETQYQWAWQLSAEQVPFSALRHAETTLSENYGVSGKDGGLDPLLRTTHDYATNEYGNVTLSKTEVFRNGDLDWISLETAEVSTDFQLDPDRIELWLTNLPDVSTEQTSRNEQVLQQTLRYTFNEQGLLDEVARDPDDLYYGLTTTFFRDRFNNVERVERKDMLSEGVRWVETKYDPRGILPRQVINAVGVWQVRHDEGHGGLRSEIDPNRLVTTYSYDPLGRPTRVSAPEARISVQYGDAKHHLGGIAGATPLRLVSEFQVTVARQGGPTVISEFDAFGRTTQRTTTGYLGMPVLQESEYGPEGLAKRETRPHVEGDSSQGLVTYGYDRLHCLRRVEYPDGAVFNHEYSTAPRTLLTQYADLLSQPDAVWIERRIDPKGNTEYIVTDHQGAPVRVRHQGDSPDNDVRYRRGPQGIVTRIETGDRRLTDALLDDLGRIEVLSDKNIGYHVCYYSGYGELLSDSDAREGVSLWYDSLGRLDLRADKDGVTDWIYDGDGPGEKGRLVETVSPSGQRTRYGYTSDRGLLAKLTRTIDGEDYTTSFCYNQDSNLETIHYPQAHGRSFAVQQEYDAAGNVVRVFDPADTGRSYWKMVEASQGYRIYRERLGNDLLIRTSYDDATGAVKSIETLGSAGEALKSLQYTHDKNGNVETRQEDSDAPWTYTYDRHDRLESATRQNPDGTSDNLGITYDDGGNITYQSGIGTYTYDWPSGATPHAVRTAGPYSFTYDAAGNMLTRSGPLVPGGEQTFELTGFDLPKRITSGPASATMVTELAYDADQEQVLKRNPSGSSVIYGGLGYESHIPVGDTSNEAEHHYPIFAAGRQVAELTRTPTEDSVPYFHHDHLGSVRAASNASAQTVMTQEFAPFGQRISITGQSATTKSLTGHEYDAGEGLINTRGRLYDPVVGRFTSPDPIVQAPYWSQGLNRYSYVFNNPMKWVDPSEFQAAGCECTSCSCTCGTLITTPPPVAPEVAVSSFVSGPAGGYGFDISGSQGMWGGPNTPDIQSV
ncbi:RHS repeat-associated core domain-containing protein, partial [Myxococcota bacterium]